jgi:hypothetical protein
VQRWRVRAAIRGADGLDARSFLPRLFNDELGHLEATFEDDGLGVIAVASVLAPDAEGAGTYVEARITASLRKRELGWIATILEVAPAAG